VTINHRLLYQNVYLYQISGGGNVSNKELDKFGPALRWMTYEAISNGLKMARFNKKWEEPKPSESLTGVWKALEYLPFGRLSYADQESTTRQ
jgi:hypothetical protein